MPGVGQRYIAVYQDKAGEWLTGGNTYRQRVPANSPVEQFWSVPVYCAHYRRATRPAGSMSVRISCGLI
jgi:hypothetical protein